MILIVLTAEILKVANIENADAITTKKSTIFHPSRKYVWGSKTKPIAIIFTKNSRIKIAENTKSRIIKTDGKMPVYYFPVIRYS